MKDLHLKFNGFPNIQAAIAYLREAAESGRNIAVISIGDVTIGSDDKSSESERTPLQWLDDLAVRRKENRVSQGEMAKIEEACQHLPTELGANAA